LAAFLLIREPRKTGKMIEMPYLLKSEPDAYSFGDLERDGETLWDGVTNPAAVKNLREMKAGDKLVIYHTGKERQAVGTAIVASVDTTDRKTPRVRIRAGKPLEKPRPLGEIKEVKLFADSPLVTQGRLSVVALTNQQYEWITKS
jgi:predicted RNA-binding protein with PUA-like domain